MVHSIPSLTSQSEGWVFMDLFQLCDWLSRVGIYFIIRGSTGSAESQVGLGDTQDWLLEWYDNYHIEAETSMAAIIIIISSPRHNGYHFADDIFNSLELSFLFFYLNIVPEGPINNNTALVQIMAWCQRAHWGHWWRPLQPTSSIITDAKSVDSNLVDFDRKTCLDQPGILHNNSS